MTLQICNTLTLFLFLIAPLSVHSMEHNHEALALQAATYNYTHPLICLLPEVQQQIAFPCGAIAQVTEDNADELKEGIKAFFSFNRVCKQLNKNLASPWIGLDLETKNRMMQEVNALITQYAHKECLTAMRSCELYFHDHPEKVSFGYKKYCVIPLSLVSSGAGADITDNIVSTTLLSKAVHAQDALAVALLLNHKADPYQETFDEDQLTSIILGSKVPFSAIFYDDDPPLHHFPIFSYATTVAVLELFFDKIDRQRLLSMPESQWLVAECRQNNYSSEVMKVWLEYGLSARCIWSDNSCILHTCIGEYYQSPWEFKNDVFLEKLELLLKAIPDMVNTKNDRGNTPIDEVYRYQAHGRHDVSIRVHEKIITLLRRYGAQTSQELAVENIK